MSAIDKVLESVQAIETNFDARLKESEKAQSDKMTEMLALAESKITALEAKIASIPVVSSSSLGRSGIVAENNKRVVSEIKKFMAAPREFELKMYESVEQRDLILEASALTGGGDGKGGRTYYDPVFTSLRQMNPLRGMCRTVATDGSSYQFRTKVGNAGTNWGYTVSPNGASTTQDTRIWTQVLMDVNSQFPIRTAALDDIDGLEMNVVDDMMAEFSEVEAISMQQNDPTVSAFNGTILGGQNGLRGLDSYAGASQAAYSSGSDGAHTIFQVAQGTLNAAAGNINITYNDLVNMMHTLPVQYFGNAMWLVNRFQAGQIRNLRDTTGAPIVNRIDTLATGGYMEMLLGFPMVISNYADLPNFTGTAGTASLFPIYFGNWQRAFTIVDRMSMILRRYDQTQPGSITFYGEKRLATSIVDPFSIVRLQSSATAPAYTVPTIGPGQ